MDEERREVLDALSDRTRLHMLEAASAKPLTGDEISAAVQRSRSTVESHLSTLLRLGLMARTKDDKRYYYQTTEKARMWMGQTAPPTSEPQPLAKGRIAPALVVVTIVGIAAGVYYPLMNSLLVPTPIWLFAAVMGIVCAWIFSVLKRLLQTFLVASLTCAFVSALVGFDQFSVLNMALIFAFCFAFLGALGLPLWYLTRRLRVYLRWRREPSPGLPVPSPEPPPESPPSR